MTTKPRDVILSIKPKYWELIKAGTKTVEFRRKWVKEYTDVNITYIYASSPTQKIVGMIDIEWIVDNLTMIWDQYGMDGGITKDEFDTYFKGQPYGYALKITRVEPFTPIQPSKLWSWWNRPPQNFMYVREG